MTATVEQYKPIPATTGPKRRYRQLAGMHYERNPNWSGQRHSPDQHVMSKAGDIIESDRELDKIYVNKFELYVEGGGGKVIVSDARRLAVQSLIQQQIWTEDDRTFLEELSEENFTRIQRHVQPKSLSQPKATSILGEDVTDSFQRAYDEGFRVWKNQTGKHQVTRGSDTTRPLNKESLDADKVDPFVARYLKEK